MDVSERESPEPVIPDGPRLGLLTRLFTASNGRPDLGPSALSSSGPSWTATQVTVAQFIERLDLAASVGATGIELTQAGIPSGAEYLLGSSAARDELLHMLGDRGLVISALNCSGMPLHPIRGSAHQALIRTTILLAEALGIRKLVAMSGVGGDGPGSTTINWVFMPWPEDMVALLEEQWCEAFRYWQETTAFAAEHGIERIALELHPLHLVYNVPTLKRLRGEVGPLIGATVDPSHLFWQSMDPIAVVEALGEAVYHVQLKDTELVPNELAIAGVLDSRPYSDPTRRAWIQRTIGRGHDAAFWASFIDSLQSIGYDDFVSIENEDPFQPYEEGVREAAALLRPFVAHARLGAVHES